MLLFDHKVLNEKRAGSNRVCGEVNILMKSVKVYIASVMKDGQEEQQTRHVYTGSMAEKNGKNYVFYDESAETGLGGTKTTLKWDEERVVIIRSGSLEHRQEFFQGYMDRSSYKTPYLNIPLETFTRYLYTETRKGAWHIDIEYTLSQDGNPYGEMKILIDIKEEEA